MFNEGGWMGAGMWLFWVFLIIVIVVLVKTMTGSSSDSVRERHDSPLEILKSRYARGEIDEEEFERRRKELEK